MIKHVGFLLVFLLFTEASVASPVIPDDKSELRSLVVAECKAHRKSDIGICISNAGAGVLAMQEILKYNDTRLSALCAQNASGRVLPYLDCFRSQLKIKENSPFAQYSTLILGTEQFRASWVAMCRIENGLEVSDCVKSKTADFYRFWDIYMNLGKSGSSSIAKFEQCISAQRDLNWSGFLDCYHR